VAKKLVITWTKSAIGYSQRQKDTIRSLGLHRLNEKVERPDTMEFRGMVVKVRHLVRVEEEEE
jgi:large subunit ribosomal protein L30